MELLYAPWRSTYAMNNNDKHEGITPHECVFCAIFKNEAEDANNFVIRRFAHTVVLLNLYPYNAGHLLILPLDHCSQLHQMSTPARTELMEVLTHSINGVTTALGAYGVNAGLNLGTAAGAGIPSHVHMHVLPRWPGDTNFLPTLAHTKQISFDLHETYQRLKPVFDAINL
jgi:ATP adenylyltransferase